MSCIAVAVPSVEEEALRDLVRAREDLRGDLMRARHRLAKLLLRHEIRFDGPQANWTQAHLAWLAGVRLAQPASQRALEDYRGAVGALMIRREQLERRDRARVAWLAVGADRSPVDVSARDRHADRRRVVRRDRRLHPVRAPGAGDELSRCRAVEHSSGERRRRGPITKSGSQHARRLLVEAAWHYRRAPRVAGSLARRQRDGEPEIVALSWKAQRRLHHVWQRMEQRDKRRTIIAVAAARELAGFCWAVATAD